MKQIIEREPKLKLFLFYFLQGLGERERQTDRQTDRQTETGTDRDSETERDREAERDRDREKRD